MRRHAAIQVLTAVTCAPVTRTMRGIRSEVEVRVEEGFPESSVITCDNDHALRYPAGHPVLTGSKAAEELA